MQKEISQNRRLYNVLMSFVVVTGFVWWVWSHPIFDPGVDPVDSSLEPQLIDKMVIFTITVSMIWALISFIRNMINK